MMDAAGTCLQCGAHLPAGARFCMRCGAATAERSSDEIRHTRLAATAPTYLAERIRATAYSGERKVVTVMFVDVVGSTTLAERMDPEEWSEIINLVFDRISPIIYRYEGTIAQLLGDGMLAFFGAPLTHEDDPARAVRASLDILATSRELAIELKARSIDFAVRVGLNTGLVVVTDVGSDLRYEYLAVGDAVNLAARMQASAQPMTMLATEDTQRPAASLFRWRDLGEITVKGKAAPVHVFQAVGTVDGVSAGTAHGAFASPLVGRNQPMQLLTTRVSEAVAGAGSVVIIRGDAGVGKTRLLAELEGRTLSDDLPWHLTAARAQCLSYGRHVPLQVIADLLHALLATDGSGAATSDIATRGRALLGDSAADLWLFVAHLMGHELDGSSQARIRDAKPESLQAQYTRAFRNILIGVRGETPLMLVVEDVHWADPSSIALLAGLFASIVESGILIVLVGRFDPSSPTWEILEGVDSRIDRLTEILLEPLTVAETNQLVANLLHTKAPPARLTEQLVHQSEGNPLFVEEVTRSLVEQGALRRAGGHWHADDAVPVHIPPSLRGLLAARIDAVPDEPRRVLRIASVVGRQFSASILERVMASPGGRADRAEAADPAGPRVAAQLRELEHLGLISPIEAGHGTEWQFRHSLVRDTAYESLLREDRRRLHGAVGAALELTEADRGDEIAATLAHHFHQAFIHEKAAKYLLRAADRARAVSADREATELYSLGLSELGLVETSQSGTEDLVGCAAQLHAGRADVYARLGKHEEARTDYEAELEVALPDDVLLRSHAHLGRGATFRVQREYARALDAYADAEAALGNWSGNIELTRRWLDIQMQKAEVHYWENDIDALGLAAQRIHPVLAKHGTPRQRIGYFSAVGTQAIRRHQGLPTQKSLGYARLQLAAAEELDDPMEKAWAHFVLGFNQLFLGDLDAAEAHIHPALAFAERSGEAVFLSRCLTYLTVCARMRGHVAEVEALNGRASAAAAAAEMAEYSAVAEASAAWVLRRRGQLAEARVLANSALESLRGLPLPHFLHWVALWPLIGVALAEGDLASTRQYIEGLFDAPQQPVPPTLAVSLRRVLDTMATDPTTATAELEKAATIAEELGYL